MCGRVQEGAAFLKLQFLCGLAGEALCLSAVQEPVRTQTPAEEELFSVNANDVACPQSPGGKNFDNVFFPNSGFHDGMVRSSIQKRKCRNLVVYYGV